LDMLPLPVETGHYFFVGAAGRQLSTSGVDD
jgi:hypothetical protein